MEELTDVRYEVEDGLAWITIDRPERLNAFRARTVDELIACFKRAWTSPDVGVVCLTGAGDRAFCTGGDSEAARRDRRLRARRPRGCSRSSACTRSSATSPSRSSRRSTGTRSGAGKCCTSSAT